MKRIISVILLFSALMAVLSLTSSARQDNFIEIDVNNSLIIPPDGWESHPQGSEFSVPIDVFGTPGVSLLVVTLEYDTDAFILVKAENGIILEDMDQGINLMWSADNDSTATGRLVTLTFKVTDNAIPKDYTIGLDARECYNSAGERVGTSTHTANNVIVSKKNDIDLDGEITKNDANAILKYIVGQNTEVNETAADINGDGDVTVVDAVKLLLYLAGKTELND